MSQVFDQRKPPRGLPPDLSPPLMRGLIEWWIFNEGSGDKVFSVVNDRSGTITNGAVWRPNEVGQGLYFDGDDDYVEFGTIPVGDPLQLNDTDFTISMWIKPALKGDNYQRILDKSSGGGAADGWMFSVKSDIDVNKVQFFVNGSAVTFDNKDRWGNIIADSWHHFCVRHDFELAQYKVSNNGDHSGYSDPSQPTPPNIACGMRMGSWNHSDGREYQGEIRDIRIYNRFLSEEEVDMLYRRPYAKSEKESPVWTFAQEVTPPTGKPVYLGSTQIDKIYLGSTEIQKAYLGSTDVFDKG